MRTAIQQRLISSIPEIGGRVLDPHSAGAGTVKPYLVLRQGADSGGAAWAGFTRNIEVWPYDARTAAFQSVDNLAQSVASALDGQRLTTSGGSVFTCLYQGTAGGDYLDTGLDAITRGLKFAVLAYKPVAVAETAGSDPWLESLAVWTEDLLGAGWAVYRNSWPLEYVLPSVLWRIEGVEVNDQGRAVFEIRKKLVGHVMGSTPNQQLSGVINLAQELAAAARLLLEGSGGRHLAVGSPVVNIGADAFTAGQLSVVLSRLVNRPEAGAPLMAAVHYARAENE